MTNQLLIIKKRNYGERAWHAQLSTADPMRNFVKLRGYPYIPSVIGSISSKPKDLPREVVVLDLPEKEKVAEDGTPLRVIGKEISEKLFYEPAQMKVIEYHRLSYGVDSGDTGKIAPAVASIIPKGIATPSLLAQIVTSRYVDGLPLYRQEKILERLRIDLSRCTMARWIISDTEDGAKASSLLYSITFTTYLNGVNPYSAFKVLYEEIGRL